MPDEQISLHDIGDLVRVSVAFEDLAGVATDPTDVSLQVRSPAGAVTNHSFPPAGVIVNDASATGAFYADVEPDAEGDWWIRWAGTAGIKEVEEMRFRVRRRVVA